MASHVKRLGLHAHLGGKMELRISSVCEDCRSAGGACCPFFFPPLPLRSLVVLTSTGLSYFTRELWGGIMFPPASSSSSSSSYHPERLRVYVYCSCCCCWCCCGFGCTRTIIVATNLSARQDLTSAAGRFVTFRHHAMKPSFHTRISDPRSKIQDP